MEKEYQKYLNHLDHIHDTHEKEISELIVSLQTEVANKRNLISNLESEKQTLQKKLVELDNQKSKLEWQIKSLTTDHENQVKKLTAECQQEISIIKDMFQQEKTTLESQLNAIKSQFDQERQRLNSYYDELYSDNDNLLTISGKLLNDIDFSECLSILFRILVLIYIVVGCCASFYSWASINIVKGSLVLAGIFVPVILYLIYSSIKDR